MSFHGPHGALAAETSELVAFQGFFRDALGEPLVAPFDLTLTIYDADTNGSVVAGPYVLNAVLPIDGAVAVEFGPVPASAVPAGESRYLGVTVNADPDRLFEPHK